MSSEKDNTVESIETHTRAGEVSEIQYSKSTKVHVSEKVDDAMALAVEAHEIGIDPETDRKLRIKTDYMLMPLISLVYAVQYMDKVTNSFSAIMGLKTNYGMVGKMYSWCGTSFYIGYLAFVFIASFLLQKFPPAKACGVFIIVWGIVNTVNFTTKTYAGFIALRTLMGMLESIVTPAMVIFVSQWWKKEEQFLRTCIYFSATSFGSMWGYAIAYGLWVHQDGYSFEAWKLCFLIIGGITILTGIVFVFYMPDSPAKAWFLNKEEKLHVVERIRANNQGFGTKEIKMYQLKECVLDYRVWLIFMFEVFYEIPNGLVSNFSSILITNLGYSTKESLLINIPLSAVGFVGCNALALCYSLGLVKHRIPISIVAALILILGSALLAFAPTTKAQLGGFFLMQISPLGMVGGLTMYSSNIAGHTKKVYGNASFLVAYCVGNLIGPQVINEKDAPSFHQAKVTLIICYSVAAGLLTILYASFYFDNKKRDKLALEQDDYIIENQEFADLTDRENPRFRYTL